MGYYQGGIMKPSNLKLLPQNSDVLFANLKMLSVQDERELGTILLQLSQCTEEETEAVG